MTEHVANALRARVLVTVEPWGCHNVTISSITTEKGEEQIPDDSVCGYDDSTGVPSKSHRRTARRKPSLTTGRCDL